MRSLQFVSLLILAVFAVDVYSELRVSDSYREDAYRKAIAYINSQEFFNDNMAKYKMEKAQDYYQISTITVMLTIKQGEENSACNVNLYYKGKGGTSDRAADYDCVPLLGKSADVDPAGLEIQKMGNVGNAPCGVPFILRTKKKKNTRGGDLIKMCDVTAG
ncbi:hypothetical protein RUM43_015094 [Polyplax serrata]|uniref:Uncharacterized protein n=1 Tax=Polyplax serrata TaxID=468196 RepID=A0AAN8P0S5_POLSC